MLGFIFSGYLMLMGGALAIAGFIVLPTSPSGALVIVIGGGIAFLWGLSLWRSAVRKRAEAARLRTPVPTPQPVSPPPPLLPADRLPTETDMEYVLRKKRAQDLIDEKYMAEQAVLAEQRRQGYVSQIRAWYLPYLGYNIFMLASPLLDSQQRESVRAQYFSPPPTFDDPRANDLHLLIRHFTPEELQQLHEEGAQHVQRWRDYYFPATRYQNSPRLFLANVSHSVSPLTGEAWYQMTTPLDQDEKMRFRHTYIIGRTRSGKSNLLLNLIVQDIENGRGVGVLSPEAEFFRDKLLPLIPRHRIDDVIYFDPADQERPIPFNPFHLERGEVLHLKAQETFTIFERAMDDLSGARMRPLLQNSIYALIERGNSTVLDLARLLHPNDPSLREEIIANTKDHTTRDFWESQFPTFPKEATQPILNRLADFLRPPVSVVLNHPRESLQFRKAMDEGKIMLFNLAPAYLGQRSSQLLGQLIISKLQQAIATRDDVPEHERRPFFFYVDEFQTYTSVATQSYSEMLAKAAKYKLGLYLAHQQTQQIPAELLADILGNVGTMVVMNVAAQDASRLSRELLIEDHTDLQRQEVGEAMIKLGNQTYSIKVPLVDRAPDWNIQKEVIQRSRERYGVKPPQPTHEPQTPRYEPPRPQEKDDKDPFSY